MSSQQPPPRKGNYLKVLKNLHTEQLSKVQSKHHQECDMLEDIRNFMKQKCAIEKSYGEAMQKIATNYLNKKMPPIHEMVGEGIEQRWTVWSVWRSLLEETDKLAKAKLAAVEIFHQQIVDDVKIVRQNKLQLAKKNLDVVKAVQSELQSCVNELDKLKKVYFDDEHVSHDARDKARDAEEKLKKKKGNIFQSISSLQKTSAKLGSRRDLCEEKSTHARNSYLLQLASANAHQNRYFNVDLQHAVKTLDGGMYEKIAEYFSILSRTELITCSASQNSFTKIRDHSATINRDYDLSCYVEAFPVLKQHIIYEFEPCDRDNVFQIDTSHGTLTPLTQNGRQYASRVVSETKKIRELQRSLQTLQTLKDAGNKVDPNESGGQDLDAKIDDVRNQLRRSETAKIKAEARLDCLRQGGIKVDEFLQDAANGLSAVELTRSPSQLSFRESGPDESDFNDTASEMSSRGAAQYTSNQDDDDERIDEAEQAVQQRIAEMRATWQDPAAAWDDPVQSSTTNAQVEVSSEPTMAASASIIKCIALYSYTAQNADELSMMENEEIEVLLSLSEGDGWIKARNYKGEEGFVPQNYLDLNIDDLPPAAAESVDVEEQCQENDHYTAVDEDTEAQQVEAEQVAEAEVAADAAAAAAVARGESEVEGNCALEAQISFSSVDYTYQPSFDEGDLDDVAEAPEIPPRDDTTAINGPSCIISYCRALYDYEATSDEELSFYEGEIIGIIRRNGIHGPDVDDGWWEGILMSDNQRGVFPSLVVEECGPNGEELTPRESPTFEEESAPPPGTPPEVPIFLLPPERVIITQPTPETEFPNQDLFESHEADVSVIPDVTAVECKSETSEDMESSEAMPIEYEAMNCTQIVITASTPCTEINHFIAEPEPEVEKPSDEGLGADKEEPDLSLRTEEKRESSQMEPSQSTVEPTVESTVPSTAEFLAEEPTKKLEKELVELEKVQESYA